MSVDRASRRRSRCRPSPRAGAARRRWIGFAHEQGGAIGDYCVIRPKPLDVRTSTVGPVTLAAVRARASLLPEPAHQKATGVQAISAGFSHTCALMTSGGVHCWGSNQSGQLGDTCGSVCLTPTQVHGICR
ncbi:MAG: hypothetical protein JW940_08005 [Polyangiaceae bacterium]|nr:hypothetical protein [Polyangiaceae bacterium]